MLELEPCYSGLDSRPLEKVRIHAGKEAHGIREGKVAEVHVRHELFFHHLVGFFDDLAHVRHVPVSDIRAQHGTEARAKGIELGVEGDGAHGVIRLAAEKEVGYETVADVFRPLDGGEGKVVEVVRLPINPESGGGIGQ